MLYNRGNYGCKQTNNRIEQLSGVGQFLKYYKHTHTHTLRFIDRKTSKLDEPQRSLTFPYYNI